MKVTLRAATWMRAACMTGQGANFISDGMSGRGALLERAA
jgi:hypothetical protein